MPPCRHLTGPLLQLVEGILGSWQEGLRAIRHALHPQVKTLQREAHDLKEVVAERTFELRLLKKSMIADGGDIE